MILPDKNLRFSHSLIGIGATLLHELRTPQTVSSLWESVNTNESIRAFEKFVLGLTMLDGLGLVTYKDGLLTQRKADDNVD